MYLPYVLNLQGCSGKISFSSRKGRLHDMVAIPTSSFALIRQTLDAVSIHAEQVQREASQQCEIGHGSAQPNGRSILTEGNIQATIEPVLDPPMQSGRAGNLARIRRK